MRVQVDALWWTCLQARVQNNNKDTVLGYAQVADTLSDATLMAACICFLTESDERYSAAEVCSRFVVYHQVNIETCNGVQGRGRKEGRDAIPDGQQSSRCAKVNGCNNGFDNPKKKGR